MQYLTLNAGQRAIVDDEDYERARPYTWSINSNVSRRWRVYTEARVGGERVHMSLKGFVLGLSPDPHRFILHKNGDVLDCRKTNLVVCNGMRQYQALKAKYKKAPITH